MRLFKVDLEYLYVWGSDSDEKKAERLRKLEARDQLLQQLGIQCPHNRRDSWLEHPTNLLVNDVQLLELTVSGNKPEIQEEVPVPYGDVSNLPDAVKKLTRLVN
ncbi:MAG: hypothetical protein ACRC8N_10440, partial [Aeromonas veronii]